jgi:hypothetical protein
METTFSHFTSSVVSVSITCLLAALDDADDVDAITFPSTSAAV